MSDKTSRGGFYIRVSRLEYIELSSTCILDNRTEGSLFSRVRAIFHCRLKIRSRARASNLVQETEECARGIAIDPANVSFTIYTGQRDFYFIRFLSIEKFQN